MARTSLIPILAASVMTWLSPAAAPAAEIVVEAGPHARANVPMSADLPEGATKVKLLDAAGKEVPCQVADGKLWWVLDELPAAKTKVYTAEVGTASSADAKAVTLQQASDKIDVTIDAKPFTTYNFAEKLSWGGELWRPCFFPVFGPGQVQMMRPFPLVKDPPPSSTKDHPWHTGVYVAHGKVNGVDDWSTGAKAGRMIHKSFDLVSGGAIVGVIREQLDWTAADRKPVMAETRTLRVWRCGDDVRVLDFELDFQAKYGKVTFGDTKEGGLCSTRMRDEMRADKGGHLVNSSGDAGGTAWGKRADYVCCYGELDGKAVGYAIFDSPENLRHPTYWHARTYGLVTANPFGTRSFDRKAPEPGTWVLQDGKSQVFRYRIVFHTGTPESAKIAQRYQDYAEPPKVSWRGQR